MLKATIKQKLRNTLRLNFYHLKIIHILHLRYHPKIIGNVLKNKQNNKCVGFQTINHNENGDENKNRSHRYDINRPRSRNGHRHSKYKKYLSMMMLICTK